MTILVTGGLGAIGKPLSEELRRRGHKVWISDRIHPGEPYYLRCDVGEFHQVENIFNRMIFTSSSEVYGDYRGVMSEDVMDKVAIRQMNDYAMTKRVNEMQILNSADRFGTETVRVRLFNAYGPGEYYSEYRSAICVFIYKALHDLPYTVYTKHKRTSSYIDDTVRTLANIVANFKLGEVHNIAGNELHDMKRVSDIILSYLGKSDSLVEHQLIKEELAQQEAEIKKAMRYPLILRFYPER